MSATRTDRNAIASAEAIYVGDFDNVFSGDVSPWSRLGNTGERDLCKRRSREIQGRGDPSDRKERFHDGKECRVKRNVGWLVPDENEYMPWTRSSRYIAQGRGHVQLDADNWLGNAVKLRKHKGSRGSGVKTGVGLKSAPRNASTCSSPVKVEWSGMPVFQRDSSTVCEYEWLVSLRHLHSFLSL